MLNTVRQILTLLTVAIGTSAIAAMPTPENADIIWRATGEFCEPETVLPLPDRTFLVSNLCDFKKSGNGFLTLLGGDGQILDWRAVEGLDAPLGMARLNNQLYVVDANRVRVYRWPGFKPIEVIDLDTRVANDIAVAPDGTIYVSDSARAYVLRRLPNGEQSVLSPGAVFEKANGMAIEGSHLYVGGTRLWCVNLNNGQVTTIGPDWLSDIDGIEFEGDGTLQLTIVGGPLVRYRGDHDIQVLGGEGVSSTNHGYSAEFGLALIPTGFDNTVIALKIPSAIHDKKN